jgi:diketogulonate reductase-like aldo/keto reductase
MNEAWIGNALKQTGVPRENLYIISKVWNDTIFKGADAVKQQVDKAIGDLQCDYIDLFLVHWPVPGKHVEAFKALCECKKEGKIREVGVSNYCIEDFEELKAVGCDLPAMNQIEVNPLLFRKKTVNYCKQNGVHVQAYRGLMQGAKAWSNAAVQEVCKETGKTPAQVLGRFLVQQGISHVPKASSTDRMKENSALFTFELSPEQMEKLSNLTTDEALETFKNLYIKCIWRDTPQAGDPWPSERTLN